MCTSVLHLTCSLCLSVFKVWAKVAVPGQTLSLQLLWWQSILTHEGLVIQNRWNMLITRIAKLSDAHTHKQTCQLLRGLACLQVLMPKHTHMETSSQNACMHSFTCTHISTRNAYAYSGPTEICLVDWSVLKYPNQVCKSWVKYTPFLANLPLGNSFTCQRSSYEKGCHSKRHSTHTFLTCLHRAHPSMAKQKSTEQWVWCGFINHSYITSISIAKESVINGNNKWCRDISKHQN